MRKENQMLSKIFSLSLIVLLVYAGDSYAQLKRNRLRQAPPKPPTFVNFNANGEQTIRFDDMGDAIDAHDGEIAVFNGIYYLYGTSYGCGFEWGKKNAPFCGFKVYSSSDMVTWTDRGMLFNASTPVWQSRCDGSTYGCFRPHVIYNKATRLYVLWINVYDNRVGFRVFTSKTPVGPFKEVAEPRLAVNSDSPVAGLNNGDHDTFVDADGKGYIAYTDWRTKGTIIIEELTSDYLSGSGKHVKSVTSGNTEAPALFRRKNLYYITYSDPNCGYCAGTGTSYKTATSPLGPWSEGIKISDNSCGGQPSFVSPIELASGTIYVYGSDLWNNAAKNEALANYYWAPLNFREDGSIIPMVCQDNNSAKDGFTRRCDVREKVSHNQPFAAAKDGTLSEVLLTTFKTGYPKAGLTVELYRADEAGTSQGNALMSALVPIEKVSWAPKQIKIAVGIRVKKGERYVIVLKSATTQGCYGFAYRGNNLRFHTVIR